MAKKSLYQYGLPQPNRQGRAAPNKKAGRRWALAGLGLAIILFCVLASQRLAALFQFNPLLGDPLFAQFYAPWAWISWTNKYWQHYPTQFNSIFQSAGLHTTAALAIWFVFVLRIIWWPKRDETDPGTHGSAKFADYEAITHMGLTNNDGVVLGAYQHKKKTHFLRHDGPEHVLMVAPTGSGKGVGVVNPTLLTWPHSIVVYDLKKECWALSSRWRKQHANNIVLRFEPTCQDGTAASYNPLAAIRLDTDADVQDVQNIATIILEHGDESQSRSGGDTYFLDAAFALMTAFLLHACYTQYRQGKHASLADVADALTNPDTDFEALLGEMKTTPHRLDGTPHPVCVREASDLENMLSAGAGRQFAGIQGTVKSKLGLYFDPIIRKNITRSDFTVQDLMHQEKPVSLYICVGSTDKARLKPLTKLVLTQIIRGLTKEVEYTRGEQTPQYKHRLLMLIDEFPSLGKMSIVNEAIAFLRGYGIKCLLIIQDFKQLRSAEAYGPDEAIVANCGVQIAFAPNIYPTADELAKRIGNTTVQKDEISRSRGYKIFQRGGGGNVSEREVSRQLLTPDEIMRLPNIRKVGNKIKPGKELVMVAGEPPILGDQILHFQDPILGPRAKLGALDESDRID